MEGIAYIKRNSSVQLSVQQIVDCDTLSNLGCRGGLVTDAFDYVKRNGGLTSADNYPYDAKDGICNLDKAKQFKASITGFARVPPNDEYEMIMAVCQQPVAADIKTTDDFQFYTGGVFSKDCGNGVINHSMTIVGMGETDDGVKYWKLKNSWGQDWGEGGYMRMIRGTSKREGHCFINARASYPIID